MLKKLTRTTANTDKDIIEFYKDKIIQYRTRYDKKINENILSIIPTNEMIENLQKIGYK